MNRLASSSLSRADEKFIRSLSVKKYRDEEGMFVVEGEKMVDEALKSSFETVAVYHIEEIGEERMKHISSLSTPSPILAVVRKPESDVPIETEGLSVALDGIRDPGNLGTILRLCDWFGVKRIFASPDTADIFSPKTVQASMGAIFRVQFTFTDLCAAVSLFDKSCVPVYGTFLDGDDVHKEDIKRNNAMVVLGNESRGISESLSALISRRLLIPPYPGDVRTSESLNVAAAAAIILYEFRRF